MDSLPRRTGARWLHAITESRAWLALAVVLLSATGLASWAASLLEQVARLAGWGTLQVTREAGRFRLRVEAPLARRRGD